MLEDSISCSPGNDKKQSRSRRFHKNTKRRSQLLSSTSRDNKSGEEIPRLEALYEKSTQSIAPGISQYEHFNPFENEIILAAADMTAESTLSSKLNNFVSQGFVRVEELPINRTNEDDNFVHPIHPDQRQPSVSTFTSAVESVVGAETQFGITESEFVRFCDEVEIEVSQTTGDIKTPKEAKSVVDTILEDFCGSPYSESPPRFIADDATPIFRFKSKSLRTYSGLRQKKLRRNIVTELANVHLPEDDGNASDSSGLSVQEDLSQSIVPQLDTVDLNNSTKVCENLLNLSSYFSQVTSHEKRSPPIVESKTNTISAIVEDIIKIKRKTFTLTRSNSVEEFHGFSDEDSDSKEDTLKELWEDEDDVLQQINCDSLCYEKITPKTSFEYNPSDIENALKSVKAVIEETNKLMSSRNDLHINEDDSSSKSQPICDKHEDPSQNASEKSVLEDKLLFDDIDLWNDNEYLLNYKTQKLHSNPSKPEDNDRCLLSDLQTLNKSWNTGGNRDMGRHLVLASTSSQLRAAEAVKNPIESSFMKPISSSTASVFSGFSTARKPIAISEEAKRKADSILKQFDKAEAENVAKANVRIISGNFSKESEGNVMKLSEISNTRWLTSDAVEQPIDALFQEISSAANKPIDTPSASTFLGFSTASRKRIAISDEAKRKADNILKKFEQEEREKVMNEEIDMSSEEIRARNEKPVNIAAIKTDNKNSLDNSASVFIGFSTASKKPITISDVAKLKADELLKNFEEAERKERLQKTKNLAMECGKLRKIDQIPEAGNQNADELLMDMEFFEEAFEEELNFEEQHEMSDNNGQAESLKQCITKVSSNTLIFDGFKTASKKSIQISEDAKRYADQLLRKVENEDLPQDFFQCIQDVLNIPSNAVGSIGREEQVDGASKDRVDHLQRMTESEKKCLHECKEFYSASNDIVSAFKDSVKFPENNDVLMRIENKDLSNAPETKLKDVIDRTDPAFSRLHAINEYVIDKDMNSSYEEYEMTETLKRKRNVFYTEDLRKTPPLISPRRLSCTERTPLNRIENGILHKTTSMPLIKSTPKSALISRKNLLSLSKRKKFKSPSGFSDVCIRPKTPNKVQNLASSCDNANATPNLKKFFDSVSTSTPRLVRNSESKVDHSLLKDSSVDNDFRQINWEDANNSGRVCKGSFTTEPNVTFSGVSPSPKQRIERLKMYGEPPPISPILMVNKCRPSGLRRGRSLMKS